MFSIIDYYLMIKNNCVIPGVAKTFIQAYD
jgi:hypothetical protein